MNVLKINDMKENSRSFTEKSNRVEYYDVYGLM